MALLRPPGACPDISPPPRDGGAACGGCWGRLRLRLRRLPAVPGSCRVKSTPRGCGAGLAAPGSRRRSLLPQARERARETNGEPQQQWAPHQHQPTSVLLVRNADAHVLILAPRAVREPARNLEVQPRQGLAAQRVQPPPEKPLNTHRVRSLWQPGSWVHTFSSQSPATAVGRQSGTHGHGHTQGTPLSMIWGKPHAATSLLVSTSTASTHAQGARRCMRAAGGAGRGDWVLRRVRTRGTARDAGRHGIAAARSATSRENRPLCKPLPRSALQRGVM